MVTRIEYEKENYAEIKKEMKQNEREAVCETDRRRRFGLPDRATIIARGSCR